ncbi:MAG: hypothetical protein COV31_02650 [Candidatus Yanofskybacteria bacterium CG10_big_fil_rev_8_21_14_0_10_46_23]|uniref:Glycosyltransferase 2-like domain-containing protein n=1 Tax=Candidatus Yanofskybacteria bacterium CG10_big_fil_rev_8_21_14_0_10_46_23 TaxID=1975098 RepID=A0A2H0R422_9BACT|nr:MAG: hypothetical protein COV31_02650 [Candidatus Yanofskybacteria bacterium CG10_big_fil_rev_8_21_14_0_10_46_23]
MLNPESSYLRVGNAKALLGRPGYRAYRFLEMLPGLLAWGTLFLMILASYFLPTYAAIFIIIFDIYWLVKTIYLSFHMRSTFLRMRRNLKRDWATELEQIKPKAPELAGLDWSQMNHLVILPMATEPIAVVRESFQSLIKSNYPREKMIVVLATEARVGPSAQKVAESIKREFGQQFGHFLVTTHPADIEGEIIGKGSNETWAIKSAKDLIDSLGLDYKKIITSVFDVDTVIPPDFFTCLTWNFFQAEKPFRSSFQPIPLFTNNIWQAPAFARVFSFTTTFWQMIQQARPEQLVTFSSQSISFQALVEVGFWQPDVVSEDSRIFWQCFLHFDGDWRTVPLHYPVYMDANVAPTFWQTLKNQYKQIRRWMYGVENNPYFMYGFKNNPRIPKWLKRYHAFNMTEKSHSASTNALLIFFLGWLPIVIGRNNFSQSLISFNLPQITTFIMLLAMVGLVSSAIISVILLPPRPPQLSRFRWAWVVLQWLIFPFNFIFFGAIPALEAQTRLMFGRYLGFWVTPKHR